MKKIVVCVLVLFALALCSLSRTASDVAQAQSVIEAARAAQDAAQAAKVASQGLSDIGRGLTFILILLTLTLMALLGVVIYLVVSRNRQLARRYRPAGSLPWMGTPASLRRLEQADAYQQMLTQQQWWLTQLLSQGQEDIEEQEPPQLPSGWWG